MSCSNGGGAASQQSSQQVTKPLVIAKSPSTQDELANYMEHVSNNAVSESGTTNNGGTRSAKVAAGQ